MYRLRVAQLALRARGGAPAPPAPLLPRSATARVGAGGQTGLHNVRSASTSTSAGEHWARPLDTFTRRHVGPDAQERTEMLSTIGVASTDELLSKTIPESVRYQPSKTALSEPLSESEMLGRFKEVGAMNNVKRPFIGMGYYPCHMPSVIKRGILENPGWYTQYTPYQSEISQGRLESLINFQTMVTDLCGLDVANASLLDEATAAAEAMAMCFSSLNGKKKKFFVDSNCFQNTIEVVKTRAGPMGVEVTVGDVRTFDFSNNDVCGVLVQYPNAYGTAVDYSDLVERAHAGKAKACCATDLLALTLLKSPGEMGFDIAFGNSQRFGVPLGYGGPSAAFMTAKKSLLRRMPGRIAGVSRDQEGRVAYRLTIQTRETHIRREKATSNICTAQALLANISAMYGVYHGPHGLKDIAARVHGMTVSLKNHLQKQGLEVLPGTFFDTLVVDVGEGVAAAIHEQAENRDMLLRHIGTSQVGISLDETTTLQELCTLMDIFASEPMTDSEFEAAVAAQNSALGDLTRTSEFMTHPVFNTYHSELEFTRYCKWLENKDISLVHSMIALGSCTMKLNAATEMAALSDGNYMNLHPFAPLEHTDGYKLLFKELRQALLEVSGYDEITFQPNSGAQGEYTGLLVISKYLKSTGQGHRNICLVPESAHGTNPASAQMCGMDIVKVATDETGEIDMADLTAKCQENSDHLAAIMITYPSTYGVFDQGVRDVCDLIHEHGGQVYLDGANMNAMMMLCRPGDCGADVSHFNLHKTFCIPHGGGGPGMGPIGVKSHLTPFLPDHPVISTNTLATASGPVSGAPFGSASILSISWAYITMVGAAGLASSATHAILNANYMAARLKPHFTVKFTGKNGLVAHEFILDLKPFKAHKITCTDVAKRLQDYGFHSPTMSWPVADSLMIEPTESESKVELDKLVDALISIKGEVDEIAAGTYPLDDNVIVNAPHPMENIMVDTWTRPYPREKAAYPLPYLRQVKFWPTISRTDDAYGDKNPVCSCPSMDNY